jgi:hypothetical protein
MHRILIGLLVAASTFFVGYLVVRVLNSYADTIVNAFYPGPSANPTPVNLSEFANFPEIPYCHLIRETTKRPEQIIRVSGTYSYDMENSAFGDDACGQNIWTWVEAEPTSNFMRAIANLKLGERAHAVFLGRLSGANDEGYGHLNGYRYRLLVMNVDELKPLPTAR